MQDYLIEVKEKDYRPFDRRKHFCMVIDFNNPHAQ